MIEIALTAFMLLCTIGIIENTLCINGIMHSRYSYNQHGIGIVLDIAWIIICAVALYVGGAFASAVISVATVMFIITVIGDAFILAKYGSIYDAFGTATHIMFLIIFLSIGG